MDNDWHNNHNNDENDTNNQTHAHFHVLEKHLFAHAVGTLSESLGRLSQVVCLVLQRVESFATLRESVDVVAHYAHGAVNLL